MDQQKIGELIRTLRKRHDLTQQQLAERMHISDKTVSKWERGCGCPDLSLLPPLAQALGVELETLLSGELEPSAAVSGNMSRVRFFVCPVCGNLLTALGPAQVSCCGRRLEPLEPREPEAEQRLTVETIEQELFVSSEHEMTREHYIAFVALVTADAVTVKKRYPEWALDVRMPYAAQGTLVWYCTRHGLFRQPLLPAGKGRVKSCK